jgi:kynurenine formamidase
MNSGWADKVDDGDDFRGGSGFPDLNFPGFSVDATDWLVTHRDPVGIGLDTMSLDPGDSATFDVHFGFLATGRYGIESMANQGQIPPRGRLGSSVWFPGRTGPERLAGCSPPGRTGQPSVTTGSSSHLIRPASPQRRSSE